MAVDAPDPVGGEDTTEDDVEDNKCDVIDSDVGGDILGSLSNVSQEADMSLGDLPLRRKLSPPLPRTVGNG